MRIRFERSGGFANVPLRAELDSAEMSPARAQELERLVDKARSFDQPPPAGGIIPDDLHYQITIENDAGESRTLHISDTAAPDELKSLLDFLGDEALKKLKRKFGG